jgi:16S rRNA C967 or C1407 C5-methylase (RsmB/RsmF family)
MPPDAYARYRAIVPAGEWSAFREALARPEPRTFRIRRGRIEADALVEGLSDQGFRVAPLAELPGVFRVDHEPYPLSETLEHWLGLFYMQQASTTLAAPALAPRPGEGVLDLCAAPGGKSSHLAELMEDRGCLVAVELSDRRVQALAGNVSRMAHPSVITVAGDALRLPESAPFHRVLVDAPCSGEGRGRRELASGPAQGASEGDLRRLPRLQEALLRKALRLAAPGGQVLYVTCTLAPEENEGVVDAVLRDPREGAGGSPPARLLPLRLPVPHAPGLTSFGDAHYLPELEGACRIYPHHLDSGGLFMALLERTGDPAPVGDAATGTGALGTGPLPGWNRPGSAVPDRPGTPALSASRVRSAAEGLGLPPDALDHLDWITRGSAARFHCIPWWPLDSWFRDPSEAPPLRVVSAGLRGIELDRRKGGDTPTGDLLRWLAPQLRQTGRELDARDWVQLLSGAAVAAPVASSDAAPVLLHRGHPLATFRRKGARLLHDLPPARADWLRQVMARRAEATPPPLRG